MNLVEYFNRINFKHSYDKLDLETFSELHEHHIRAIPFENLSIHCGETIVLDTEAIYDKIVRKNRGGWCCENNGLFSWVLKEMGYDIILLRARVYKPAQKDYERNWSHLLIKVVIDGKSYLADVGFGVSYQIWKPLELVSGKDQLQVPGTFRLTEDNCLWHLEKISRKKCIPNQDYSDSPLIHKSPYNKLYCFTLQPCRIESFQDMCNFLQVSPVSLFTNKSICSLQTTDGIRVLVGWSYCETTYNYKENMDLVQCSTVTNEDMEKLLTEKFNITLEGKFVPVNKSECYTV
ncbi:arylamine N-acetyltransferase, pineal gland isozyme NAT-10-like isoform X3 [Latimeria chalumnae]